MPIIQSKTKKHFNKILLGAAMVMFASPAMAQDNVWQVSRVDSADGENFYCAAAKRFDGKGVLTFARNKEHKSSLAIDLEKDRFMNNQRYDVTLKPDDFKSRDYAVSPVSPSAFVVRIGQDDVFQNAISASKELEVDVDGLQVRYQIEDYKLVSMKLDECLGMPVGTEFSMSMPEPEVEADNEAGSTVTDISSAAASASVKNVNRASNMAGEPIRITAKERAKPVAKTVADLSLEEKVKLLERQNLALNKRLRSLGDSPQNISSSMTDTAVAAEYQEKLASAQSRLQLVEKTNRAHKERIAELESALNSAQRNLDSKSSAISTLQQGMENAVAGLPNDVRALKTELMQAKTALTEQQGQYEAQISAFEQVMAQNENAVGELEQIFMQKINDLKQDKAQSAQKIQSLEQQLASASGRLTGDQKAKLQAYDQLATELASVKEAFRKERQGYEQTIASLRQAQDQTEARLATLQEQAGSTSGAKDEYENQIADLERILGEKDTVITKLETQLSEAQSQAKQSGKSTENIDKLNEDIAQLKEALTGQKQSYTNQIHVMEQVIETKEAELAELRQSLAEQQMASADANDAVAGKTAETILDLEREIKQLKNENNRLNLALAESGQGNAVVEENYDLASKLRRVQTELDLVKQEKRELREQIVALQNEKDMTLVNISGDDWDLEQATRRFNEAERQLERLGRKLATAERQCKLEKKALEYKLFDPKFAGRAQAEKLMEMETKLSEAQQQCSAQVAAIDRNDGVSQNNRALFSGGTGRVQTEPVDVARIAPSGFDSNRAIQGAANDIAALLSEAGVRVKGGLQEDSSDTENQVTYRWDTGTLFGSAEVRPMQNQAYYDQYVDNYIGKLRKRCNGDFASVPVVTTHAGGMNISSYDIACVTPEAGVTVTVIFHGEMDRFTSIAHEASVDHMDIAMEFRDKIIRQLSN